MTIVKFYAGTSSIKSYGNSAYKKDTLVKYEFNPKDEQGNKVMDKMSREETIQAMNDIRSQYGDNVIVEFSGDGMAAFVENKKEQADEAVTEEQRAAKAGAYGGLSQRGRVLLQLRRRCRSQQ